MALLRSLLALALLVADVRADHPNHAFAADHSAVLTDAFHRRTNFHGLLLGSAAF